MSGTLPFHTVMISHHCPSRIAVGRNTTTSTTRGGVAQRKDVFRSSMSCFCCLMLHWGQLFDLRVWCPFDVLILSYFFAHARGVLSSIVQHRPALPSIAVMLFTSHPLEAWLARWFVWTWGAKMCQKIRSLKLIIILPSKLCFFGVHPIFRQSHILGMPTESHPPRNPSAN